MAEIDVEIVATAGKLWSGTAYMVSAKAGDGEIGILAGHEPFLSVLQPGELRVFATQGAEPKRWQVEGGFLSFDDNHLTIVADNVVEGARPSPASH